MKLMLPVFLSSLILANSAIASNPLEITTQCERLSESSCHQYAACTWVAASIVESNSGQSDAYCKLSVNDKLAAAKAKVLDRAKKKRQKAAAEAKNRPSEVQSTREVKTIAQAPRGHSSGYGMPNRK